MVKASQPPGAFSRGLRLGKLGLSLTGSYLGYQIQNFFLGEEEKSQKRKLFQHGASRRIRRELEQLKGPAMKLGQLLSTQAHALPDEAIEELANLHMRAPGMHPTLARAQFKSSIRKYPEEVFRHFEPEPFAAASPGQVHRAVTKDGQKVAVKIQYPAIRTALENDFKLLRSALLPGRITGHMPVSILDEVQRGFSEETDYLKEAGHLDFFGKKMAAFSYLTIPTVHREVTSDRVLTMSMVEGKPLGEFMTSKPSQAVRDLIGFRLLELFYFQLQSVHVLHADHHPGNYLLRPDGRIGLVDFGCVKHLSSDVAELCRCCIDRVWKQGKADLERVIHLIWGPKVPFQSARDMLPFLEEGVDILFPCKTGAGAVVDFGRPELLKIWARNLRRVLRNKLTNPEFAFLTRAELGLYGLLHQLRARVNTREAWERAATLCRKNG